MVGRRILFGDFALDADLRELRRGAEPVALAPQAFDLLLYLVANRDRVVSKDDMLDVVWKGRIVSESTRTSTINAVRTALGDSGEAQLFIKTVHRKGVRFVAEVREATTPAPAAPALPARPSIAVLPFENLSDDPGQTYFADGVAEDLLTTLSKIPELFVVARSSSFAFRGQSKNVGEIGRQVGARYVLDGSVRRAGQRVRLTAQLVDAIDGGHKWADRYDGELENVFDLQDRITQDIVGALEVKLTMGEQARIWRKRAGTPLVYENYLRGRHLFMQFSRRTHLEAQEFLERAVADNPGFTPAWTGLGMLYCDLARFGWAPDPGALFARSNDCVARALDADPCSGDGHVLEAYTKSYQRQHDAAVAAGEKAVRYVPSSTDAYHIAAVAHGFAGNFDKAAAYEVTAERLSPLHGTESLVDEARYRVHLGEYDLARSKALEVLRTRPRWLTALTTLLAADWHLGNKEAARATAAAILQIHPKFSISWWATWMPYRSPAHLEVLTKPLGGSGLPT